VSGARLLRALSEAEATLAAAPRANVAALFHRLAAAHAVPLGVLALLYLEKARGCALARAALAGDAAIEALPQTVLAYRARRDRPARASESQCDAGAADPGEGGSESWAQRLPDRGAPAIREMNAPRDAFEAGTE